MLNIYILIALLIVSIFLLLVSIVLLIVLFVPKETHLNYRKDGGGPKIRLFMETNCGNIVPVPDGEYTIQSKDGESTCVNPENSYFSLRKKLLDLKKEAKENGLTKECEEEIRKQSQMSQKIFTVNAENFSMESLLASIDKSISEKSKNQIFRFETKQKKE